MKFVEIINQRKYALIGFFLMLYVFLNLLDGERGLISYFEKKKLKSELIVKKETLTNKLNTIEKKNSLLMGKIDLDYLETLFRQKFMLGKSSERIFNNIK